MATRTTKGRTGRATRSRTEVQDEFGQIQSDVTNAEAVDPKTASASRARSTGIRNAVQGVTVEGAVTAVTQVGLSVQKALAGVNEQLLSKVTELQQVAEAVELEKQELEALHKIDIAATAIDILVQDYTQKTSQLENDFAQRSKVFHENEAEREKLRKANEQELAVSRQRERDEYEYKKAQERRAAEDAFNQQLVQKQRDNADKQTALEKGWAERENGIRVQEQEITKIRQEVVDQPARLRKEFETEKAIALSALKSNLTHEHTLVVRDLQAEARIQAARIGTLEQQLMSATEANVKLQQQLTEANAKIETIASRAIDGAAKRDAFEQLMSVTKEQGANTSAGRGKA